MLKYWSQKTKLLSESSAIPLLIKAVEFLFDEGKRFLENRRKAKESGQIQDEKVTNEIDEKRKIISEVPREDLILSKEDAENDKINKSQWLSSKDKVEHLTSLLEIHKKNYYLAEKQYAIWGNALVPQIVVHNLIEAEKSLNDVITRLEREFSEIYGKKVITGFEDSKGHDQYS